jgi:hypothetical protein
LVGYLTLVDATAPAYARRGILFPGQAFRVFQLKDFWALWLCSAITALVPLLNVFLLPGYVAAGTLMVARQNP